MSLSELSNAELLSLRDRLKDDIAKNKVFQLAKKVQLNSAYGALGNQYFRFYDVRQAEAVTLSGQYVIRWIHDYLNAYFNKLLKTNVDYVIAVDTDSVYLNLEKIVTAAFKNKELDVKKTISFLEKYCLNFLQKEINNAFDILANYTNSFQQKMNMKLESLADRAIWTAKKRYVLNVHYSEGVTFNQPELKIMGIEAIKSSTPAYCRDIIRKAIQLILNENVTSLKKYLDAAKTDFYKQSADVIASPRTCNNLVKYSDSQTIFKSKTPIQVRGSLLYNKKIKEMSLHKKYEYIKDGDKIKFFYLKEPNPINSNVLSITTVLPKEFELDNYIDYNLQFEKTITEPLRMILDVIGWNLEERKTLFGLFQKKEK
jgi:DNA polymerase elongation subunit (family B)